MAIISFSDKNVEMFFVSGRVVSKAPWKAVAKVLRRKLDMLHYAHQLMDLRSPPGNRLEALGGDLQVFYSIRVNDQWRIVFRWAERGPAEVAVVDYH